ncbi:DUF1778 domain-containing protein [Notoacmeibacter sp. MSK16QG-6]|uniref:type II toxin-antitoxin system TacA family antitoxin n=1 Tax=Notoacmeibacter sp. MSK16QG-6 TaxID=2957982 RepID=UPI00209CDAE4|nr:DUF1778 domain-containing protein [Notoacmeibacter sp. MSK16QG-6]MCP1197970.1 DUF1778 domain-containing protein [Notoacmeibacter sp. MSK16QG-6]
MTDAKTENFAARIAADDLSIIKRAARISGRSVSSFVVSAAKRQAEETLREQILIEVEGSIFDALDERLSQPGSHNPELAKLLGEKAPWNEATG